MEAILAWIIGWLPGLLLLIVIAVLIGAWIVNPNAANRRIDEPWDRSGG